MYVQVAMKLGNGNDVMPSWKWDCLVLSGFHVHAVCYRFHYIAVG